MPQFLNLNNNVKKEGQPPKIAGYAMMTGPPKFSIFRDPLPPKVDLILPGVRYEMMDKDDPHFLGRALISPRRTLLL